MRHTTRHPARQDVLKGKLTTAARRGRDRSRNRHPYRAAQSSAAESRRLLKGRVQRRAAPSKRPHPRTHTFRNHRPPSTGQRPRPGNGRRCSYRSAGVHPLRRQLPDRARRKGNAPCGKPSQTPHRKSRSRAREEPPPPPATPTKTRPRSASKCQPFLLP